MMFLGDAVIVLATAVVAVPLLRKVGIGAAASYLIGGVLAGPHLPTPWFFDQLVAHRVGEIGLLLFLFVVGLEFRPSQLWALRGKLLATIYGLAFLMAALFVFSRVALDLRSAQAAVVGIGLSLSSAAVAFQRLSERKQLATRHGRLVIAGLSLEAILAVAVLTLLILAKVTVSQNARETSPIASLSLLKTLIVVGAMVLAGRFAFRPLLRFVAASRNQDTMTAAVLLLLSGSCLVALNAGLSMAVGSFLAAAFLANSEYRYEVESRVEPFKGLALGVFFMSAGMSLDPFRAMERPLTILLLTFGVVGIKFMVLLVVGRKEKEPALTALALPLAQGGEFGFAIFTTALALGFLDGDLFSVLSVSLALTMAINPALLAVAKRLRRKRIEGSGDEGKEGQGDRRLRLFLSYSRRDIAPATKLSSRLEDDFTVSFDIRDLPPGERWQTELEYQIRRADTIVWVVSRASLLSQWCRWELRKASDYVKRIVPVAIEDVPVSEFPKELGEIQLFPATGLFNPSDPGQIEALREILRANNPWLKEHTRLSERAHFWEVAQRHEDFLLRGAELAAAERWRDEESETAANPGARVLDLIHASRLSAMRSSETAD
jgi:Kef-type K+ transport system membrane component KefB